MRTTIRTREEFRQNNVQVASILLREVSFFYLDLRDGKLCSWIQSLELLYNLNIRTLFYSISRLKQQLYSKELIVLTLVALDSEPNQSLVRNTRTNYSVGPLREDTYI
jgi:hypothetical protein